MDYGKSVQQVLLRKIYKAEQDLLQLKLDYCRFVFGLTHRARVVHDGKTYIVRSVDVDTMRHLEDGGFSKPVIMGTPAIQPERPDTVSLGSDWTLETKTNQTA
ncbi:hypothetical protein LPB19_11700 [Marinobacter salinisoli]|uniref:Uncharacterized protein n=1 Tax=Marinobacter salinisoli TaxID=2769486 RepID=A0ABX7MP00_9GAMM|nr:hypothetical protein [Marinobacter salinisoli]QSP93859.1 hypothetical protein LPB19_11700 [Marinobacter salinisoli]